MSDQPTSQSLECEICAECEALKAVIADRDKTIALLEDFDGEYELLQASVLRAEILGLKIAEMTPMECMAKLYDLQRKAVIQ